MPTAHAQAAPAHTSRRLRRWSLALLALFAVTVAAYGPDALRSVAILGAAVEMYDPSGLTQWVSYEVGIEDRSLQLPDRTLRSRRYAPRGLAGAPVAFVLHGVHPRGIDEPRLKAFARALAAVGIEVHTPELPELAAFRAEPRLITDIAGCARALQRMHAGRKVGAFGISFAGGLLLVAAASPDGTAALDYVVAIGAHHDMSRLARYYAGLAIATPAGGRLPPKPHPYGGRILASVYAAELFGGEASAARHVLALHLAERYRDAASARARLSAAAQARLREVLSGPSATLQPLLMQAAARHAAAFASLSPAGRLARLRVPVFLLHGLDDPVVPSMETEWLAREVPEAALRRVLVTPALRHAESAPAPSLLQAGKLVAFVAAVLREAGD